MTLLKILLIVLILVALVAFGFLIGKFLKHKSLYPLLPFKYDFRKRRITFRKTIELLDKLNAKIIIETGTSRHGLDGARSQGAATIVFGKWAQNNGAILHSVDISEDSVKVSKAEVELQGLKNHVNVHLSDSVEFLKNFNQKVDLLYLDSYDYSDDPEIQLKSQQHHLEEFKAIEKQLHVNTVVLIDDCDLPGGGKGKLAIEYMVEKSWVPVLINYQILLIHKESSVFESDIF